MEQTNKPGRTIPILFNSDMVRAILDGRKTCTRRVVKPAPAGDGSKPQELTITRPGYWNQFGDDYVYRQPCKPGDILYVRETWCKYSKLKDDFVTPIDGTEEYYYRADGENPTPYNTFLVQKDGYDEYRDSPLWCPSIHMPKDAARIFLRVTAVQVEQLQAMGHEDAEQEGCWCDESGLAMPLDKFAYIWDSTIKPTDREEYGWEANPWVWVITFERISKEEANDGV